jgi:hypothetical protein
LRTPFTRSKSFEDAFTIFGISTNAIFSYSG